MVAGISGATPGSGAGVDDEEPNMLKFVVSQPASKIASVEMMARLATGRALPDLIMGIPPTHLTAAPVQQPSAKLQPGQ